MPGSFQQLVYSNMIFADNGRAVTLRYANEIDDNTIILKNSYITAISRPSCPTCYGPSKLRYCSGAQGVRMFSTTVSGELFPLSKKAISFDVICNRQAFDSKAFFDTVTF